MASKPPTFVKIFRSNPAHGSIRVGLSCRKKQQQEGGDEVDGADEKLAKMVSEANLGQAPERRRVREAFKDVQLGIDHCLLKTQNTGVTMKEFASSGYGVFALDYPGFGLSEGLHGYIPSFDSLVNDVIEHFSKI